MDTANAAGSSEIVDYGALLKRRWRLVVGGAMVGLLLATAYVLLTPKSYTSQASVLVIPTGIQDSPNSNSQIKQGLNLDTEAQIAQSVDVATAAKAVLDKQHSEDAEISPDRLRERISVTVPPNSTILTIAYVGSDPHRAAAGAQAFAQGYLDNRKAVAEENLANQINRLDAQIKSFTKTLEADLGTLGRLSAGGARKATLAARVKLINATLTNFQSRRDNLSSLTVQPGRVISNASVPTGASSPNIPLALGGGMLIGLLVGLTTALLRDRVDRQVRTGEDVQRLVDLPVLMEVGSGDLSSSGGTGILPARSKAGQAFHELGHTIDAVLGSGNHVVLVTGVGPGRAGGMVAANLAAALSRIESSVVLICADLHSTVSTRLLGVPNGPGLAELLLRTKTLAQVARRPPELDHLRVLTPGFEADRASERLQTNAMAKLVAELRRGVKYVVIEAPPTSGSADAQALAEIADGAVIVVEARRTRDTQIKEAMSRLDRMRVAVLGAAMVPSQGSGDGRSGGSGQGAGQGPGQGGRSGRGGASGGRGDSAPVHSGGDNGLMPAPVNGPTGPMSARGGTGGARGGNSGGHGTYGGHAGPGGGSLGALDQTGPGEIRSELDLRERADTPRPRSSAE